MSEHEDSGNGARGNHRPRLGERVEHIGNSAQQLITEARDAVDDLKRKVDFQGRMERHPYTMLAAAAAVGYVLGGGLLTSMTARLIKIGLKVAALPLIKDELMNLADSTISGFGNRAGTAASSPGESSSAGGPPAGSAEH
jgi:ElaB/YqjD/DUF883 family membrane-anchored ribosome-binding protein